MIAATATAAALVLLAACGGGSGYGATAAPAVQATAPADAPGAAPAGDAPVATNTVAIQNFAFSPATVTVKAGTVITWTNQDQDAHTVTSINGPLKSPTLNNGQSFHYTFTTPGTFAYVCTIHPLMTATVMVTP